MTERDKVTVNDIIGLVDCEPTNSVEEVRKLRGRENKTEKRFTDDGIEEIENQSFTDNLTGKTYWIDNGLDEIVNLLNALNDENEQLKSTINTLTHDNTKMKKVLNTTKNENITLKKSETATEELLIQQWQQNTKIKHTIKEAIYNERTELGKSVLKQLLNNIEAIQ